MSFIALGDRNLFNLVNYVKCLIIYIVSESTELCVCACVRACVRAYFGDFSSREPVTNLPTFASAPN